MALNAHDDQSTIQLLTAFDQTQADCNAAQNAVESTASYIASVWGGGAATEYRNAITQWQDGLNLVRNGLGQLTDTMHDFHQSTHTTEQTSADYARWMPNASWT